MPIDVCTQHLLWIPPTVLSATPPPFVAELHSRLRTPVAYELSFRVFFRGCLLTEGESKYTFNIKAQQRYTT